jgi:hypothetical protein
MSKLSEYYARAAVADSDDEAYLLFREVCENRLLISSYRQQQLLECVALTSIGTRGDELKLCVMDRAKFDELAAKIASMEALASTVESMFLKIDTVIEAVERHGYILRRPTLEAVVQIRNQKARRISLLRQKIQDHALMHIESGCAPHLLAEAVEEFSQKVEAEIKPLQADMDFLDGSITQIRAILDPSRAERTKKAEEAATKARAEKAVLDEKARVNVLPWNNALVPSS